MDRKLILLLSIVLVSFLALVVIYIIQGPGWDVIAYYLNAKSFLNPSFAARNYTIWGGVGIQHGTFYVEIYRSEVTSSFLAFLSLLFKNPIFPYLVLLYALYILSIWMIGRAAKIDRLIIFGLMLNPFFLYMSFRINSAEIVSLIFVLIAISLLIKRSVYSGLFFGIAAISKYLAPIYFPLILFLKEPKKIIAAMLLFVVALIPYMAFNYYFFGDPVASFLNSLKQNVIAGAVNIYLVSIGIVLLIPAIYLLLELYLSRGRNLKALSKRKSWDYTLMIGLAFIALSVLGYCIVAFKHEPMDQIRFGYFIVASLLFFTAILFNRDREFDRNLPQKIGLVSLLVLVVFIAALLAYSSTTNAQIYNPNLNNSIIGNAVSRLNYLGYGDCRVVSNDWVYLLYWNVKAYSPFSSNATTEHYPIVLFKSFVAVPGSLIPNLNESSVIYSDDNFSVLLPLNVTCVN